MLKLGFHCLGLLKQRWTPSQFYTKHCLLSPQRSLSRDLSQNQISAFPCTSAARRHVRMHLIDRGFPVHPPFGGHRQSGGGLPSTSLDLLLGRDW